MMKTCKTRRRDGNGRPAGSLARKTSPQDAGTAFFDNDESKQTKTMKAKKRKHVCCDHPDRIAAVSDQYRGELCWECKMGKKAFAHWDTDTPKFYEPGGPGYAGDAKNGD
jgi:ABC-type Fe3+-hydroxamate transport system substrate-binding protein